MLAASSGSNMTFMDTWMDQVWNKQNDDHVRKHMAKGCIVHGLPGAPKGPEAFIAFRKGMSATITDLHIDVLEQAKQGKWHLVICKVTGTHARTGKSVAFTFGGSARVRKKRIREARNVVDFLTVLLQTGLISPAEVEQHLSPPA